MKKSRGMKLLILLLAVLVMVGVVFIVKDVIEKKEAAETEAPYETFPIFILGEDTVKNLTWTLKEYPGTVYSFTKNEEGLWDYDPDPSFKVKHTLISSLVGYIRISNSERKLEATDLAAMGLAEPAGELTITTNSGRVEKMIFGNLNGSGSAHYCMNGDGNVYLLKSTIFPYFNLPLGDFEDTEETSTEA